MAGSCRRTRLAHRGRGARRSAMASMPAARISSVSAAATTFSLPGTLRRCVGECCENVLGSSVMDVKGMAFLGRKTFLVAEFGEARFGTFMAALAERDAFFRKPI